jgi:hypothetical protein
VTAKTLSQHVYKRNIIDSRTNNPEAKPVVIAGDSNVNNNAKPLTIRLPAKQTLVPTTLPNAAMPATSEGAMQAETSGLKPVAKRSYGRAFGAKVFASPKKALTNPWQRKHGAKKP